MQAGAGCSYHPAPCLRRYGSIHNGFTPHFATTIIPFFPGENKGKGKDGDGFLCIAWFGGAVYGFFSVHRAIFCCLAEGTRRRRGSPKKRLRRRPGSRDHTAYMAHPNRKGKETHL